LNISKLEDFLVFFGSKFPKIELDLGEVGCAKNIHFPNERRQAFYSLALLREIRTKIIGRFNIDTIGLYVAETPDTLMGEGVLMDFGLIRRAKDQMVTYLSNSRAGFNPLRESVASLKKTSKRI